MINARLAQFEVSETVDDNRAVISDHIARARPDQLLVLPEGALSGYRPEQDFIDQLDANLIRRHLGELRKEAQLARVHLCLGSFFERDGDWYLGGIYFGPDGALARYEKANLANLERGLVRPGNELRPFDIVVAGQKVRVAFQLCRELRAPEQWQYLARRGTQIFLYLNNAVGHAPAHSVWRSHMISRAAETQRFVLGANNAVDPQNCPTMGVDPMGQVLGEASGPSAQCIDVSIDLSLCSTALLAQSRLDLVPSGDAG